MWYLCGRRMCCFDVGVQCGICVIGGCVVSMWEYSVVFVWQVDVSF